MKKYLMLIALASASLSASSTRAQEVLDAAPIFGDIVKNADGSIRHANQRYADEYCRDRGFRLPTARELAQVSQSRGAAGIRETAHVGVVRTDPAVQQEITAMRKEGYAPFYAHDGIHPTSVDFYYSYVGYQRPAGEEGSIIFFWSSTKYPFAANFYYRLHVDSGHFNADSDGRYYVESAIRCVLPR